MALFYREGYSFGLKTILNKNVVWKSVPVTDQVRLFLFPLPLQTTQNSGEATAPSPLPLTQSKQIEIFTEGAYPL